MRAKTSKTLMILSALALFIALFSSYSYALGEISAYGEPNIRMCSCSPVETKIVVKNNEAFTRSYELLIDKKYSEMIGVKPYAFALGPGQSIDLIETINPSCSIKDADYDITYKLLSSSGSVKTIKQRIKVTNCDNIQVAALDDDETICSCGTAEFKVQVNNSGYYNEDYEVFLDSFADKTTINQNPSVIGSGNGDILLLKTTPDCKTSGDHILNLNVKAKESGLTERIPLYLHIKDCYDFDFSVGGSDPICSSEEKRIPINIKNKGPLSDSFTLWFDNEYKGITLSENNLDIKSNSGETSYMIVKAPFKDGSGINPKIYIRSESGRITKSYNIPIKYGNCFDPEIGNSAKTINVRYSKIATLIPIKNTGNKKTSYVLSLETGQNWIGLKENIINVDPSKTGYIELITSPPDDMVQGIYPFTVIAKSQNNVAYAQDFNVLLSRQEGGSSLGNLVKNYGTYIGLGLLLLIIIILAILFLSSRKDKDKKEKDVPKKKEKSVEIKKEKHIEIKREIREKQPKRQKEIEVPLWPFILILLLAILGALSYYGYHNWYAKPISNESITTTTIEEITTTTLEEAITTTTLEEITTTTLEETTTTIDETTTTLPVTTTTNPRPMYSDIIIVKLVNYINLYKWYVLIGLTVLVLIIALLIAKRKSKNRKNETKKEERKSSGKKTKEELFTNISEKPSKIEDVEDKGQSDWPLYAFLLVLLGLIIGAIYYIHIKIGITKLSSMIYALLKSALNMVMANILFVLIGLAIVIILFVIRSLVKKFKRSSELETMLNSYSVGEDVTIPINERIGIGEISFRIRKRISGGRIYLRRLFTQPTFLRAGKNVYRYFEIKADNIDNESLSNILLRFRIKKYWVEDNNINVKTLKVKRYEKRNWEDLSTRQVDEDEDYLYFETRLPEFSYYAITAESKEVKVEKEEAPAKEIIKTEEIKPEKKAKGSKEEKKAEEKEEEAMMRWPLYVLAIVIIAILASLIYYNYDGIQDAFQNLNKGTSTTVTTTLIAPTTTLTTLYTDDLLSAIGDGRYKYDSDGNIFNTESSKTLSDDEFADILITNKYDIIVKTNLSIDDLNEKVSDLSSGKEAFEYDGIPPQAFMGNTEFVMDLSEYFYDPDEDSLTFNFTPIEHINIIVEGDKARLTPERNWYGHEVVYITADDGKGGIVESNEVVLIVKKSAPLPASDEIKENVNDTVGQMNKGISSIYSFIYDYFSYIMAGIVILLIVILFVRYSDKMVEVEDAEEKKEEKKESINSKKKK